MVTGASSGIGLAITKSLIEAGANVIAVVRNINSDKINDLNQIKEKHENAIKIIEINLESEEEIKIKTIKLIKDVDDIFGLNIMRDKFLMD